MSHLLISRLESAIAAAPYDNDLTAPVPHLNGSELPMVADSEGTDIRVLADYDLISINAGYKEPSNAVLVEIDELWALFTSYSEVTVKMFGKETIMDIVGHVQHERHHGRVFEALGAQVLCGMRFGTGPGGLNGEPVLKMSPYTVAPNARVLKLGIAAMWAAPLVPSPSDMANIRSYGYSLYEVARKVEEHNSLGRHPHIPEPKWLFDVDPGEYPEPLGDIVP